MFNKKELKFFLSHSILIMFSLIIMLPLLWLLRVALTNKVPADKLPPEWGELNFLNFIDIFVKHPFLSYFTNSIFFAQLNAIYIKPLYLTNSYKRTRRHLFMNIKYNTKIHKREHSKNTFKNIKLLIETIQLDTNANSIFIASASTFLALPLAAAMAYAFTRFNTGGTAMRLIVLSTQLLPPVIVVLPLFSLYLKLSLLNNHFGLIISHITISLPFLAWILVSFFEGNLIYLEQAARVEGASRFQAFLFIAIPVSAPGLIAAGVLAFILSWNEFILALILSGPQTNTIPVGLSSFQTHRGVDIAPLAAATICAITPVFILLPFMKKYLISGLSLGALK